MSMVQSIGTALDRVLEMRKVGFQIEFGHGAGKALAHRFSKAEEAYPRRYARAEERWIGEHKSTEDGEFDLDRVAFGGRFDVKWFCATMLVDGVGQAHGMMECWQFRSLVGHGTQCSMRTDRRELYRDRRRRSGVISAVFLSWDGGEEREEGKQDKGSVSRHLPSDCLHILFLRDSGLRLRDMRATNGRNPPYFLRNRETPWLFHA